MQQPVWHLIDECSSTQDVLKSMQNKPEWTCVLAESQTGGRGRHGRDWQSARGNMFLSVYLEPDVSDTVMPTLALLAGLALWQAVKPITGNRDELKLKWPNDLLFNGKKLAGILPEREGNGIIIGVGVNIKSYPSDVPYPATSLIKEAVSIAPAELARIFVQRLQELLPLWVAGGFAAIHDKYNEASIKPGSSVKVRLPDGDIEGEFSGVNNSGTLMVKCGSKMHELQAGEIMGISDATGG